MSDASHEIPQTDADLVKRFFSLGDNCEFGIVQRKAGAEPLGLFRFNLTRIESIIAGLKVSFADLAEPGNLLVDFEHGEWFVRETTYKFLYHTFNTDQHFDRQRLVSQQTNYLRFLARGFLEGLKDGEHIYVRRATSTEDEASIRLLGKALRDIGPVTLLWVSLADDTHPAGSAKWLDDGIMHGRMRHLAPYHDAYDADLGGWITVLRSAWALRYLGDSNAFPRSPTTSVLLTDFGGWTGTPKATAEFEWGIPASPSRGQIMKHVLIEECGPGTGIFGCLIRTNLTPAAVYVASAFVWLPDQFKGDGVGLAMHGTPRLYRSGANAKMTGVWQFVWAVTRTVNENPFAFPMLYVAGPAGTMLFTSGWRLEAGAIPSVADGR
jgi:hypothetical protein